MNKEQEVQLILNNLKLVPFVFSKYVLSKSSKLTQEYEDFISCGNVGLVKSAQTYDESTHVKFSSYATKCILNEMRMYYRTLSRQTKNLISIETSVGDDLTILDMIEDLQQTEKRNDLELLDYQFNLLMPFVFSLKDSQIKIIKCLFMGIPQCEVAQVLNTSKQLVSKTLHSVVDRFNKHGWKYNIVQDLKCPVRSQFDNFESYFNSYSEYIKQRRNNV